jgi:hypothetical protein
MGPMESAQDGGEDSDSEGYTTVDRDNERVQTAHQFVPYIARKPGLCAYCKGVLIGNCYFIQHSCLDASFSWLSCISLIVFNFQES